MNVGAASLILLLAAVLLGGGMLVFRHRRHRASSANPPDLLEVTLLVLRGKDHEALTLLKRILPGQPNDEPLYYLSALLLLRLGRHERALAIANNLAHNPMLPTRLRGLVEELLGDLHAAAGRVAQAREWYERQVREDSDGDVTRKLAALLERSDLPETALATMAKVGKPRADHRQVLSRLHTHLAENQQREGRPKEAVRSLREAVKLDPDNDSAALALADCSLELSRPSEALDALSRLLHRRPDWADALLPRLENASFRAAPSQDLTELFSAARTGRPEDAFLELVLARIARGKDHRSEALEHLRAALRRAPDFLEAWLDLVYLVAQDRGIGPNEELSRLLQTPPGGLRGYRCTACGASQEELAPHCASCNGSNTLVHLFGRR
ncbi:MAG: hypothetical protein A2284_17575 [Deltaproteobacteria bacterium RIFOXYA12_FULL_61_11]|nr:MAG: hypothetical protein A2284_17575 [Deltaproteobacteria bacterium RIFOXYA12_FULL_61_11]